MNNNSNVTETPSVFCIGSINYRVLSQEAKTVEVSRSPNAVGSIIIPSNVVFNGITYDVVGIEDNAFSNAKLTSITLPNTILDIGRAAFGAVEKIVVDSTNKSYVSIGGVLFSKDRAVLIAYPPKNPAKSFIIPIGVRTIGCNAFDSCKNLDTITIPETVNDIQECVFSNISLKQLIVKATIPPRLDSLSWKGFIAAEGFVVKVPEGCADRYKASFGWKQFAGRIYDRIPEMLPEGNINYKVDINKMTAVVVESPQASGDITIVKELSGYGFTFKVVGIGADAFKDNQKIETIYLPDSIQTIGVNAFCNSGISKFDVDTESKYYKTVDDVLFSKDGKKLIAYPCQKLKRYTIPSTVTTIGEGAFSICYVTKLTVEAETPPVVEENGLAGVLETCIEIIIPKGCTEKYKNAPGWKELVKITKIKEQ